MNVNTPTLPTVTQYIKNVGKSISYASAESLTGVTPNIKGFIDNNDELFKVIYSSARNYKQTMREVNKSFKKSKVYDAVNHAYQTTVDDLKTGNWYNKSRIDRDAVESMMGADFADFELDDSDFFIDDDSSSDTSTISKSAISLSNVIANTSQMQNDTIVSMAGYIADTNMASTKALSAQNEKTFGAIVKGFNGVTNGVSFIASIMNGPMIQHINESARFYGDVSNKLTETNAYLREITEMQRNLYKVESSNRKDNAYDNIAMSGTPDLKAYAKNIIKNLKDLDPTGGMLTSDDESNMLKMIIGNPMQVIPLAISKAIVPAAVTKSLESFDESIKGYFSSFIARMNKKSEEDALGINFTGLLGRIFGIRLEKKDTVNPSKYNRGPMPFDGETKKAIVDVIPAYLARIESAVSGMPERVFDGRSGRFRNLREIRHEYNNLKTKGYRDTTYELEDTFLDWASQYARDSDKDNQKAQEAYYKSLNKKFKTLGKKIYEDGGDFRPYAGVNGKDSIDISSNRYMSGEDAFTAEEWMSFMRYLKKNNRKATYSLASNAIGAIQDNARAIGAIEGGFANPFNALFDDRIQVLDKNGHLTGFNPKNDSKFQNPVMSTNEYLKDILAEVSYIRRYGVKGIGGNSSGKNKKRPKNFDDFYEENFGVNEDMADPFIREYDPWFRSIEKEESEAKKYGLTKENILEYRSARTIADKWKAIRHFTDDMLKTPAKLVAGVINTADTRLYTSLFGNENGKGYKDEDGNEYKGYVEYLMGKTGRMFDTLQKKIENAWDLMMDKFKASKLFTLLEDKVAPFIDSFKRAAKNKWSKIKDRGIEAYDSTFGRVVQSLKEGRVVSADQVRLMRKYKGQDIREAGTDTLDVEETNEAYAQAAEAGKDNDSGVDYDSILDRHGFAFGGRVKKYGLAMLSPGEIVIPNPDLSTRRKNAIGEKKERRNIINALRGGNISHYYNGSTTGAIKNKAHNVASKVQGNEEYQKAMNAVKKVTGEIKGNWGDVAVDALIGSGVSLLTGLVGGPLLGAAAGTGFGLVQHSETLQKVLFGETDPETEQHKGGIIPKSVQNFFKEHSKGMIDFGLAGAVTGLFTPLGLVGGAMAGAALGYAKDTDGFKKFIFGDAANDKEGLISKETVDKIKKAYPNMLVGAGAGILMGPFGLVGNALLGASAGYVTSSDTFSKLLLGEKDSKGKRTGGILGAIDNGLVTPLKKLGQSILDDGLKFVREKIFNPSGEFIKASVNVLKNTVSTIGNRISDGINGIFQRHVGIPLEEFLREKVFKRMVDVVKFVSFLPMKIAKGAISAPFSLLGSAAKAMNMRNIKHGAYTGMNAKERLEYREKNRSLKDRLKMFVARNAGGNQYDAVGDGSIGFDKLLASANSEELEELLGGLQSFRGNRGKANIAFNNKMKTVGTNLTTVFDNSNMWDKKGHALFINASGLKKKILKAVSEGDFDKARKIMVDAGFPEEQINGFLSDSLKSDMSEMINSRNSEFGANEEMVAKLKATGIDINKFYSNHGSIWNRKGNTKLDYMIQNAQRELRARKNGTGTTDVSNIAPEITTADNTTEILKMIRAINENLITIGSKNKKKKFNTGDGTPSSEGIKETISENGVVAEVNESGEVDPSTKTGRKVREMLAEKVKNNKLLSTGVSKLTGFFSKLFGNKDEEEPKDTLFDKIKKGLVGAAGIAAKGLGILGKVGIAIGGVVGLSLLGHGSEFLKTKVSPWMAEHVWPKFKDTFGELYNKFKESKLYKAISGVFTTVHNKISSGEIWTDLSAYIVQGVSLSLKNIVAPLTEAIICALPDVIVGIGTGIVNAINPFKKKKTVKTNFSATMNATLNKINGNTGKNEAEIAKAAGVSTYASSSNSINDSFTFGSDGTTSTSVNTSSVKSTVVNENGINKYYSDDGEYLGATDENGNITTTAVYEDGRNSGFSGSLYRVGTNAFKRGLATGGTPTMAKALGKISSKITNGKLLSGGLKSGLIKKGVTTGVKGISSLANKAASAGNALKSAVTNAATNSLGSTVRTAGALNQSTSIIQSLGIKITAFGEKLVGSSFMNTVFKYLTTSLVSQETVKKGITKLFKILPSGLTKVAGNGISKIAAKAAAGLTPLSLIFWGASFGNGFVNAENMLGVSKEAGLDISVGSRFVIGLINAINSNLLLGLIPTDWLLEKAVDIFGGLFSFNSSDLAEAKKVTEEILTKEGIESGETVTLEQSNGGWFYNLTSSLKNKLKFWEGKDSGAKNTSDSSSTSSTTTTREKAGEGRYGGRARQGGIFAGMKYGKNSTIGQSGCGPIAAANIINGGIPEAANYAQNRGYVAADGSTDIGFFNDYFGSKGIPSTTTFDKNTTMNAIKGGRRVVLLGQNNNSDPNSAYSRNPHFITTNGMIGNGRVKVYDPELGNRVLNINELTRNMKASVITGNSGRGRRYYGISGRGTNNSNSNITTIINVAKSQVGYVGGKDYDNIYGIEYGMNKAYWCVMFVWWVFKTAGLSELFPNTASCGTVKSWASSNGRLIAEGSNCAQYAMRGDLILFNFKGGTSPAHIGICYKDYDGSGNIYTIDGNTGKPANFTGEIKSHTDEAAGNGVFEKCRDIKYVVAVIRPAYNDAKAYTKISTKDFDYNGSSVQTITGDYEIDSDNSGTTFFDKITDYGKQIVKAAFGDTLYNAVAGEPKSTQSQASSDSTSGSGRRYYEAAGKGRNYASKLNNSSYSKYSSGDRTTGSATKTVTSATGTVDYETFLNSIVSVLMTISSNTAALKTILEILSDHFDINASTEEVQNAMSTREKANQAINQLMKNKSDAEEVSKLLQTKDTDFIMKAMTEIARQ